MVIAVATNRDHLGANPTNTFHYQKFNLRQIVVYRNGQPIVVTPISKNFSHRIYFNTLEALYFLDKGGHGTELTNCSISVQFTFDGALAANVEILLLGERSSTFYVNSERKVTKSSIITYPTDE